MPKSKTNHALLVGAVSVGSYVVNYYLRNLLSVFTPQLLDTARFTVEHIGVLSSVYMLLYAVGQLINGFLGDRFPPKNMVLGGILLAGASTAAFPFVPQAHLQIVLFALLGFGLSMVRGPLMKIIAENVPPNAARTICVFFSFASFAGPLIASVFAMLFGWMTAFAVAGGIACCMGVISFTVLSVMERRGLLTYKTSKGEGLGSITSVFKIDNFVFYMLVACLVEISGASISFWIPTYLTTHLGYAKDVANLVFSAISTLRSLMPFAALAIFRLTGERDVGMMRVGFSVTTVAFVLSAFVTHPIFNTVLLLIALLGMSCVSALLWSIYIPGLGKTGKVSSVNGILDCTGYAAAALANILFAAISSGIGWSGVSLVWAAIGGIGLVASLFVKETHT